MTWVRAAPIFCACTGAAATDVEVAIVVEPGAGRAVWDAHELAPSEPAQPPVELKAATAGQGRYTIEFTPHPEALGKPIATQNYWMRLQAGRAYTVTLGGVHAGFEAGLTIFPNLVNGAPVAQSVGERAPG